MPHLLKQNLPITRANHGWEASTPRSYAKEEKERLRLNLDDEETCTTTTITKQHKNSVLVSPSNLSIASKTEDKSLSNKSLEEETITSSRVQNMHDEREIAALQSMLALPRATPAKMLTQASGDGAQAPAGEHQPSESDQQRLTKTLQEEENEDIQMQIEHDARLQPPQGRCEVEQDSHHDFNHHPYSSSNRGRRFPTHFSRRHSHVPHVAHRGPVHHFHSEYRLPPHQMSRRGGAAQGLRYASHGLVPRAYRGANPPHLPAPGYARLPPGYGFDGMESSYIHYEYASVEYPSNYESVFHTHENEDKKVAPKEHLKEVGDKEIDAKSARIISPPSLPVVTPNARNSVSLGKSISVGSHELKGENLDEDFEQEKGNRIKHVPLHRLSLPPMHPPYFRPAYSSDAYYRSDPYYGEHPCSAPWYARGYHPRSYMSCHPEYQSSYGIPHLHGGKSPSQGNELDEDSAASAKEETEEVHKEIIPKKNSALNKCTPMEGPVPSKFWGDVEQFKDYPLPIFDDLVNFPDHLPKHQNTRSTSNSCDNKGLSESKTSLDNRRRHCVMCGKTRIYTLSATASEKDIEEESEIDGVTEGCAKDNKKVGGVIIPRQNKGLCTECDVTVWVLCDSGVQIKWCKGCKNFRPWAGFGEKGGATKCVRCRDRQKEKYASQKKKSGAAKQSGKRRSLGNDRDFSSGEDEITNSSCSSLDAATSMNKQEISIPNLEIFKSEVKFLKRRKSEVLRLYSVP